jgi:HlyD family secretion protein
MARSTSKTVLVVFLIVGIGVLVFVAAARPGRERAISMSLTHAVHQDLSSWTTGNGKIEPIDPRIIQAQLTTRIESINAREGQTVKAGDRVLSLDSTDANAELAHMKEQYLAAQDDRQTAVQGGPADEIAQIDVDLAKTNTDLARLMRERDSLSRLLASQAATRLEVEQNRIALEKTQADKRLLEQKRMNLSDRSRTQAERATLRADEARDSIQALGQKVTSARVVAPVSGTIYSLPARTGTFVHVGDTLAEMADLKQVRVRAFIDEPELGSLKEGQIVEITWDALPNRVWMGQIVQLPKTIVTRGSRNVGEVLCSVNNDESELLPNINVNVRIRTAQRQNALTLERAAVRSEGNKRYVFVVEDGRLKRREITIGISNPAIYEVLSGITENDTVALQVDGSLREGQLVTGS